MRIALVHDWLLGMRGGEKCLEVLCQLWPDARLYTLLHRPNQTTHIIDRMAIATSFLQHLPGAIEHHRYFLPIMPAAAASLRVRPCDLVISLSHCVAKSVRPPAGTPHLCYCFTPMRYAWHLRDAYLGRRDSPFSSLTRSPISTCLNALRAWDRRTAQTVTQFVAISRTVEQRIRECYGRSSTVVYPPVDAGFYSPAATPREPFYLCVSALVPYKRLDIAVEACRRLGRRLVIIGSGPEQRRLDALAGPHVQLLGWQSDEQIRDHYRRCRALLFPGEEDFGIVPLEAQACGAPVIAYGAGGAAETVIAPTPSRPGTGLFFQPQTAEALAAAMLQFEAHPERIDARLARRNAQRYSIDRFAREMQALAHGIAAGCPVDDTGVADRLAA